MVIAGSAATRHVVDRQVPRLCAAQENAFGFTQWVVHVWDNHGNPAVLSEYCESLRDAFDLNLRNPEWFHLMNE